MPSYDTLASSAIRWLLESDEPAIRFVTRRDLLDEDEDHATVERALERLRG